MNDSDLIESLTSMGGDGGPGRDRAFDVSASVLRDIRTRRRADDSRGWAWAGGLACSLAVVAAVFAGKAWSSFDNPLTDVTAGLTAE